MSVETYSPKELTVIVGGVPMTGYADGTFVNVSRNEDTFGLTVGADGEAARVKNSDRSGTIVLTLLQTSDSNDVLSGLAIADELTLQADFPVLVKDSNGRSLYESPCAWIMKPADSEFSDEITEREWTIQCGELIMFVGGNN